MVFNRDFLRKASKVLWAAVLLCLPVTSFRFIPFLGAGTFVRPLAIYPLVLLLPVLLVRVAKKDIHRPFPPALLLMLLFIVAVLAGIFWGAVNPPLELGGVSYFDRAIRSLLTLGIGLAFLLAATWSNQNEEDTRFTVRWLLVGFVLTILWSAVQFYGLNHGWRPTLTKIQSMFSVRGLVKNKRVSGFAYEPSWLAGQIATLYLPFLFAMLISNTRPLIQAVQHSVERILRRRIPMDLVAITLFGAALIILLFTYSRSGLAIAVAAMALAYLVVGRQQMAAIWHWFKIGFTKQRNQGGVSVQVFLRMAIVLVLVAAILGAGIFLSDKGYIAVFTDLNVDSFSDYIQNVYLGPRVAYLQAALSAYQASPIFGVGFGASGFWIYDNIPDWALSGNPELARQLSPNTNIFPNPKNLPVRLLAETGIIGFGIYLVFLITLLRMAYVMAIGTNNQGHGQSSWIGIAGFAGVLAILMLGMSQDSVAMPELWLLPGILIGVYNSNNFNGKKGKR